MGSEMCIRDSDYIDWKQNFYDDVLSRKIEYHSNLISDEEIAQKAQ